MPTITLNFNNPINVSIQSNNDSSSNYNGADIVYFQTSSNVISEIGPCKGVSETSVTCEIENASPRPSNGDYIFFAKPPQTNISGIVGYYAEVDLEITATTKKELYAVNSEIFESSK